MTDNPYPLPNDELEKDRLNMLHDYFSWLFRSNVLVPIIKRPTQIGA